ncbi:MAG TPA: EamA family transporter [Chitinophagaceae bacterium]|nr:EamA family transporter [Chitinophagaceae bacterium]
MTTIAAHKEPSKGLVIAAFAALYIIWGSTYLGMLLAIKTIPPFFMAGTRFLIAGALLYGWCLLRGEKPPAMDSIWKISLGGILMLFIGTGAVVWAEQYIPTGLAAIIVATVPLWFVLLDKKNWKKNFSDKMILFGLLLGFAGVLLLFAGKSAASITGDSMKIASFFVLIVGTIGWAIGSLYSKYKKVDGSTTIKAAVQMLAAGVVYFLVGFIAGDQHKIVWDEVTLTSVGALAYLILFGSLVGYMSYIWLLSVRQPTLVGTYAYVNPVVAVFLGWLVVGEQINRQQIIALSVVLTGVILVGISGSKKER